jgi:site-specific recombinase XerC
MRDLSLSCKFAGPQTVIKAAKGNRHGHRDATMILIGFRHGQRVSELCSLQWSSIEFETGTVYVRRAPCALPPIRRRSCPLIRASAPARARCPRDGGGEPPLRRRERGRITA